MRIINEILLKIWDKLKKNNFFKVIECCKNLWKLETNYVHVENMWLINDKIRNLKKMKKKLNFLIDPLIESGPDP